MNETIETSHQNNYVEFRKHWANGFEMRLPGGEWRRMQVVENKLVGVPLLPPDDRQVGGETILDSYEKLNPISDLRNQLNFCRGQIKSLKETIEALIADLKVGG